jgi:hypothetical protein
MLELNNSGCVLGETNGGATATKAECQAAFGLPDSYGRYPFMYRGTATYNLYVRDLY